MKTLAIILTAFLLSSCAWIETHQDAIKTTGGVIAQRAAIIAFNTVLTLATSPRDEAKKQDYLDGLAVAFRSNIGNVLTSGDVKKLAEAWTPEKPHWNDLAERFAVEWERLQPKTSAESARFLEAFAAGLNMTRDGGGKLIITP